MPTIFLDTNIFLECRDIKDLPWHDLFNDAEIKLLVATPVMTEIDNFKGQGNTRRSKRARSASEYFKTILKTKSAIAIKSAVTLGFISRRQLAEIPRDPSLNMNKKDDQIVSEIVAYSLANNSEEVYLLSNDTLIRMTAEDYSIKTLEVPEAWILAPEPDENAKKLKLLQSQLEELRSKSPSIALATPNEVISLEIKKYAALTPEQIEATLNSAVNRAKVKIESYGIDLSLFSFLGGTPSQDSIDDYNDSKLPKWKKQAEVILKPLHTHLHKKLNTKDVSLSIENSGSVPGDSFSIIIEVSQGLVILDAHDLESYQDVLIDIPEIPPRPQRHLSALLNAQRYINNAQFIDKFVYPIEPTTFNKHAFYWQTISKANQYKQIEAHCQEFRHKLGATHISFAVTVEEGQYPEGGMVTCTVSAKNLPEPVILKIPVNIKYTEGDVLAYMNI